MSDQRLRQLSRIYGRPIETNEDARAAISAGPGILASSLFLEAVESDDVTSVEGAREYLEERLAYLGALAAPEAQAVRELFVERVHAWE